MLMSAVETNERGALHVHGLLWLAGNLNLHKIMMDVTKPEHAVYRESITQYVDSVFSEVGIDLDQEAYCGVVAERSVQADISSVLQDGRRFAEMFDEEANFCAGATQIHTHSPTCVKYSLKKINRTRDLCRFKAPWKLVEKTAFTPDGVLQVRRSHSMVNRWNKAIAVGLRHNHDISFIATQSKTLALVYYLTNYTTKVEDPVWKRVIAAAELVHVLDSRDSETQEQTNTSDCAAGVGKRNKTRQFLMRVANRVFTERALSQVEVVASLLGFPTEFSSNSAWTFLNVSLLYWHVFQRWRHLREYSSMGTSRDASEENILVEENGQKVSLIQAYPYRGNLLRGLCLYDYMSLVQIKRAGKSGGTTSEVPFDGSWAFSPIWTQTLRQPGKHARVCIDGYLSMDFLSEENGTCFQRAAVQHLGMFVPWEQFLHEVSGDINAIWAKYRAGLSRRISHWVENIQLLRRSAEDAKRDARQWAASSGEGDLAAEDDDMTANIDENDDDGDGDGKSPRSYRSGGIGDANRLIDVVRSAIGTKQITSGSEELSSILQQLCNFQQAALSSSDELNSRVILEVNHRSCTGLDNMVLKQCSIPVQSQLRAIKSQQAAASREIEKMIQGIQSIARHETHVEGVVGGFRDDDVLATGGNPEKTAARARADVRFGPSTSFFIAGKRLAEVFTLNRRQSIAFLLICRHLDLMQQKEATTIPQLCEFIGGEGGTGKSRVIEALVELFRSKSMSNRLLVTATSGTAAARINGITIHSACNFSKDMSRVGRAGEADGVYCSTVVDRYINGPSRTEWQEKHLLVIDEVSMLGARTLWMVNERLCRLRGSPDDFGGIPIILFCGDFHQFRPVQERSILLPSGVISWDEERSFSVEQRHEHNKAHNLWKRFATVVLLNEQVRAAGDPQLHRLLTRIRTGTQDQSDLDLLNARCYRKDRRIPWESGITVVTPLNRNRWNLNMEATVAFWRKHQSTLRIFMSAAIPVPAVFMFVPGMPVVINQNIHQGLKLVNGAGYTAVDVIPDKVYPGHRVSADIILHFGPPAGILLSGITTKSFHFVGMPPGTILLTPVSVSIRAQRSRPWQVTDVSRKGLPCTAAFACTDYKVQGRTLDQVALELRGTRTTIVDGKSVPSQCDPYSLYVQLSRCPSLDGIMLLSKVRYRDFVGNRVPESMAGAEARLESLSNKVIDQASGWLDQPCEE
ncbi:ATP-dependent DNA helicase PIF1 [Pochonia chlamydosporia 170]|uniref:ATP-dependent DNA helicase n=1 Tax=Pochonia chlamydosporia 170 TaxID=1380566 RepID=A0A219AN46_METCM|nr:ATP-dependent DNA helicase PIF1 [Pochonia chlamydosporia 170]OWT42256.1 ATP-dependent DNA helicase PIF1 [Pochonia chlamydosporia 170]